MLKLTNPKIPSMAPISAHSASSSTSTHSIPRCNYDVFLSFSGEDTGKSFTDHLYNALQRKGILSFRDDEGLDRGEIISEKHEDAIEGSMLAIIVLSQNYASSLWCLDELQKIVDLGRTAFPVFYGVNPSDIRHQKGYIGRTFEEHEKISAEDEEKVRRWRQALTKVANLAGWTTKDKGKLSLSMYEGIVMELNLLY